MKTSTKNTIIGCLLTAALAGGAASYVTKLLLNQKQNQEQGQDQVQSQSINVNIGGQEVSIRSDDDVEELNSRISELETENQTLSSQLAQLRDDYNNAILTGNVGTQQSQGDVTYLNEFPVFNCQCESRFEQKRSEGGGNTPEDMKEQARQGADHRGSLDVREAVEPVEKTLNGLTDRTDKCRERVAGNQRIAF